MPKGGGRDLYSEEIHCLKHEGGKHKWSDLVGFSVGQGLCEGVTGGAAIGELGGRRTSNTS